MRDGLRQIPGCIATIRAKTETIQPEIATNSKTDPSHSLYALEKKALVS
ncbi:hypothetical protein JMA_34890 [Jeotgalibacillus malaysiensis]|uniref:Uncharacterized protein n=1 Tax=Jeotgalibacillus malaysiensis TaxID=1508404 RepID=A0A0B5ARX0_9BACL|nr:hypothetical protein JMA_34890 [Jeotgalibacillus malaysiensis]